nr:hypothetical protein [Tanacetum cinerariifolium]
MAAALSLSLFLQIDCGKYCIRIPFRRSSRAVRTSCQLNLSRHSFLIMMFPEIGSSTLLDKVIVALSNLKSAILSVVASLCISSGYLSSLAVGSYSDSGNLSLQVGMPCVFYSQQSSPKLDAPFAIKFPE